MNQAFNSQQISFLDLGSKSDIVKLRGPKDDVDKCSKVLNKMLRELQESSYQEKVKISFLFSFHLLYRDDRSIC